MTKTFEPSEKTKEIEKQLKEAQREDRRAYHDYLLSTPPRELNDGHIDTVSYDSDLYELYKLLHDRFHGE